MKRLINLIFVIVLILSLSATAFAQENPQRPLPPSISGARLSSNVEISDAAALLKLDASLFAAEGVQQVVVRLNELAVAEVAAAGANRPGQQRQLDRVLRQQQRLIDRARGLDAGAQVLGVTKKALNAVMLEVDADALAALAEDPAVVSIRPVINYEMDLSETVPYIGGTAVHDLGFDGSGIRVAVLDSGIDYLHANLGGSGDPAEYAANDPTVIEPGTFPTAKVIGGYDFVGGVWPDGALMPDPDPLDDGPEAGHGTHVGDIIAGVGGVAPGASLYAVKVCSSVSTSCSGVALLQAIDFAVDPNGDGDTSDHVDIINMSLGSPYGMAHDDNTSLAVDNASAVGVLTVASAGNSSDKPYVTGTPGGAPTALAVAQTEVPSAFLPLMEVVSPASIAGLYETVFQPWSAPLTSVIEAPIQYGVGSNTLGCDPFPAGSLAGKIGLVDRGACNFTLKIKNIGDAGGVAGIIGLVAPGEPFSGGDGGDRPITIPGYMISQADSNRIKSGLAAGEVVARFNPAVGIPLIGHVVGSSSRGPSMVTNTVKPEIGAPGASVSAIAGTGTDVGPFGGTSGAAPMVSGSAALVMQAFPDRSVVEVKSLLMNTAETNIINKATLAGGDLAPISRIGGGEVRVDRAVTSPAAAWDTESLSGALSFRLQDVPKNTIVLHRTVTVRNYSDQDITYNIQPTFRYANDEASGAVVIYADSSVFVPAHGDAQFHVTMEVHSQNLPAWTMNSGSAGADPAPLTLHEYDGYLFLDGSDGSQIHVAWHVLPRRASDVGLQALGSGEVRVKNDGAGSALVESYSLIATSEDLPEGGPGEENPTPDFRYIGYATFPVPAGFCSANPSFVMAFAVNTWERQTHANVPASFNFFLDTNQDGTDDYLVLNRDLTLNNITDGRNVTWVANLATGAANAFFFTDHETNSANTVLTICGEQIGMNASNFGQPINVTAVAQDFYFGGDGDEVGGITIAPAGERFVGVFTNGGVGSSVIGPRSQDRLSIFDTGSTTNNTESGLLLLYRGGAPEGNEAGIVQVP